MNHEWLANMRQQHEDFAPSIASKVVEMLKSNVYFNTALDEVFELAGLNTREEAFPILTQHITQDIECCLEELTFFLIETNSKTDSGAYQLNATDLDLLYQMVSTNGQMPIFVPKIIIQALDKYTIPIGTITLNQGNMFVEPNPESVREIETVLQEENKIMKRDENLISDNKVVPRLVKSTLH